MLLSCHLFLKYLQEYYSVSKKKKSPLHISFMTRNSEVYCAPIVLLSTNSVYDYVDVRLPDVYDGTQYCCMERHSK